MASVLHGSARTTPRPRAEFQASQESTRSLAARYGVNPKTVAKWRGRLKPGGFTICQALWYLASACRAIAERCRERGPAWLSKAGIALEPRPRHDLRSPLWSKPNFTWG